ncbi:Scr1 family TA system antitoxin-like transcriptional regulator [Nocardiopsis dassonvillei]|uniref:Scr1 family TA system antitoxin-like transcriptional regulator n=1 Tax=Nocardiopsis dassonvillei TaxID=2014 RepID=UPI0033CB2F0C
MPHTDATELITDQTRILEQEATGVTRTFAPATLAGSLQTEDYARAVIRSTGLFPTPELEEEAVRVRMDRHHTLLTTTATYVYVITRHALDSGLVSDKIMSAQLDHLDRVARLPHVDLRVLPVHARVPWTLGYTIRGGFVSLETPGERIEPPARTTPSFETHFARLVEASTPYTDDAAWT